MLDLFSNDSGWGRFGNALGNYAMNRSPMLKGAADLYNDFTKDDTASKDSQISMDTKDPGSYKGIVGTLIPAYGMIRKMTEANRTSINGGDNPFEGLINGNEDPTEKAGIMASAQQGLIAPQGNMQSFNSPHNSNSGLLSSIISMI